MVKEDLIGISYEDAVAVLTGEKRLTGDSNIGIDIESDPDSKDYVEGYVHVRWYLSLRKQVL